MTLLESLGGQGAWKAQDEEAASQLIGLSDCQWIANYNLGLRQIALSSSIDDAKRAQITNKVLALNALAQSQGLPPIQLIDQLRENGRPINAGRRAIFSNLRSILSSSQIQAQHLPHSVAMDMSTCTACDLCVRICPSEALSLVQKYGETFYQADFSRCDGCGLCQAECATQSLTVAVSPKIETRIFLVQENICEHCKVSFRQNQNLPRQRFCSVCQKHKHLRGDLRIIERAL